MAEESFAAGLVGIVLDGRYRLDALLGEGGMGAVFRAHHLAMDRKVAVKLLKPHLTSDESALHRFAREARATMRVDSEHAVKVLDFGITPHRDYYMVLEYLDGRTVQRELDVDGPFEPARVVHVAKQALLALGAAHASGLVHRDIKPDNLLLMRSGDDPDFVKVLDFGVAKLMDGAARTDRSALAITQAGMVFGTPEFMSPEQACGQQLDGRSDLYSLAATMFAMLTGCGLYRAKSPIEWLTHHARTPPPHLTEASAVLAPYKELDTVLQSCLAKHREDRPQTAEEMANMLAAIEHTLGQGRAPLPALRGPTFSPSTYVPALDPNATIDPASPAAAIRPSPSAIQTANERVRNAASLAETVQPSDGMLAPSTPRPPTTSESPATTTGVIAQVRGRSRGAWLAMGAIVVAGTIAAAVVLATRDRTPATTPVAKTTDRAEPVRPAIEAAEPNAGSGPSERSDDGSGEPTGSDVVAVATPTEAPPGDEGSAHDRPATRPEIRGVKPEVREEVRAKRAEIARLLAEAEEAKRTRSLVRWVLRADAALRLDPHNVKARLLLADGLIASGDLERGCKYLRDLRRNPSARARAAQAGCPTD
ncbi:MAG TPA: protein kinase [Kofleriaceae bacterium]|nr:protein kinase [Kofleriaceae bacterium]